VLDPIVARIHLYVSVAGADVVSGPEAGKAAELLAAKFGVGRVKAAMAEATRLKESQGSGPLLEMAIAALEQQHPDKAGRAEIVRECVMVAGADDVSSSEQTAIGHLMRRWGLGEADFSLLDPAAARVLLYCLVAGADGSQGPEAELALSRAMQHVGAARMGAAIDTAQAMLEQHSPADALMLAIRSLSNACPDRASRIAIVREALEIAASDGTLSDLESMLLAGAAAAWGLTPRDFS
jgi:uncharacterized tellurite resistance protein B-like protein